jgi:hypothetical protein
VSHIHIYNCDNSIQISEVFSTRSIDPRFLPAGKEILGTTNTTDLRVVVTVAELAIVAIVVLQAAFRFWRLPAGKNVVGAAKTCNLGILVTVAELALVAIVILPTAPAWNVHPSVHRAVLLDCESC